MICVFLGYSQVERHWILDPTCVVFESYYPNLFAVILLRMLNGLMDTRYNKFKNIKSFIINFGPQHPAAHWCFAFGFGIRCCEIVLKCVPHGWFFA